MIKEIAATFAFVLTIMAALAGIHGCATAHASPGYEPLPTWPQEDFPCQEDEVLGYAPYFGPDRVGCISIDALR